MGSKRKSNAYKGVAWTLGILFGIAVVFGLVSYFSTGNALPGKTTTTGAYDYTGSLVDFNLIGKDLYTGGNADFTCYVYDSQPSDWDNGRVDVQNGYISSYYTGSGSVEMQEESGTYYLRCQNSTYYDVFLTIDIPSSGEVPLNDYNDGGAASEKISGIDIETLSLSNQDLGTTTNGSTDVTYTATYSINIDDNEGYMLDTVKFQEDATYSFATDSDGDNTYDEGVNKMKVTVAGTEYTLFSVEGGIDEFGGDDLAVIELAEPVLYGEEETMTFIFKVTCDAQLDTTGDGDEMCGAGEDLLDSIIVMDAKGNTATFDLTV